MKLNQLRNIIREEVKAAVKEELQDMLNEAVKIASLPDKKINAKVPYTPTGSTNKGSKIDQLMEQTKASMTNQDYKQVFNGTSDMVKKPNFAAMMANNMGMTESSAPQVGLDISKFDFVNKAAEVYKASVEKDKAKYGIV